MDFLITIVEEDGVYVARNKEFFPKVKEEGISREQALRNYAETLVDVMQFSIEEQEDIFDEKP